MATDFSPLPCQLHSCQNWTTNSRFISGVCGGVLNHPGEAMGYRVSWQNYAVAYTTDTENFNDRLDRNVLELADRSDVLIDDSTYTDQAAQVKQLVIFHHYPTHNDEFMDAIEIQSQPVFAGSIVAREGMKILVNQGISIAC